MKLPNPKKTTAEKKLEKKHSLEGKKLSRMKTKFVIFNVINIVLIVFIILVLRRLPVEAERVKQLRSESATHEQSDAGILQAELDRNRENIERISEVFVNDARFLRFISSLNELQQTGVIRDYNLPVTTPVLDSAKYRGLPVALTIAGNQDQVNQTLRLLANLPYVLRPVNVSIDINTIDDEQSLVLRYGGFLYTDESFNQN